MKQKVDFNPSPKTSYIMKKVKAVNTRPELILRKALWNLGLRYRINNNSIFGKPDIAFVKAKIAIFVDGAFWHGYNWENKKLNIKKNREYWISKIERNIKRDEEVSRNLDSSGWRVIRFWDFEILKDNNTCLKKIIAIITRPNNC